MKEISIIAAAVVQGQTRAAVATGSVRGRNQAIKARPLLLLLGREMTDTRGTMGKAVAVVVADLRLPLLVPNAAANHIRAESDPSLPTPMCYFSKVCT